MHRDDMPRPIDLALALGLLTRLPVTVDMDRARARGPAAAWAWPLVGLAVGAIAVTVMALALWAGLPAPAVAVLVILTEVMLTGAMHEDGLADSADGLWGGWTRDRRLAIMKDSRIGTFGVIALGLALIGRWGALTVLVAGDGAWAAILAAAVISRAPMAVLMAALPNARTEGLSAGVGRPSARTAGIGAGLALLAVVALVPGSAGTLALVTVALTVTVGLIARARIGGQTGDILGAAQQVTLVAALMVLSA